MCRFLETICIKNGALNNLENHQSRVARTFGHFFPDSKPVMLAENIPRIPDNNWYKWRVVYDREIRVSELVPYSPGKISRLYIKDADFDYSFKFEDRTVIKRLRDGLAEDTVAVFARNGYLTDAEYANIAFESDGIWYTPDTPLLEGTKRELLIKEGKLLVRVIKKEDIKNYDKICLINAMLDIGDCIIPVESVCEYNDNTQKKDGRA